MYGYDAHPHVQTYVAATDKEGLKMLIDAKTVFRCHKDYQVRGVHVDVKGGGCEAFVIST